MDKNPFSDKYTLYMLLSRPLAETYPQHLCFSIRSYHILSTTISHHGHNDSEVSYLFSPKMRQSERQDFRRL